MENENKQYLIDIDRKLDDIYYLKINEKEQIKEFTNFFKIWSIIFLLGLFLVGLLV